MKYVLSFCCCFFVFNCISQQKFSKEISLVTDNDLYTSVNRDRYYTSGVFINYRYLTKLKNNNLEKRIVTWKIGHKMYTPHKPIVEILSQHDRPFAAYLFGSFGIKRVYKKNKILNTSIQIGVIGPNAQGYEVQNFIHKMYGYREVTGWKHQIKNAFGLNFGTEYVYFLGKDVANVLDAFWVVSGNLGTVQTDISSGFNFRFSFTPMQTLKNSIAFNTHLNDDSTKYTRGIESFFYFKPTLRYAMYDATLQGSFLNTGSVVTKELVPFVFDMELGFKFTANRFNFGYVFNYNTSKSKGLRYTYGNKYGTIIASYSLN
ncbi:lipid A deacylase LpxR family protein [Polaribacter sp. R77954]|uniref:lipid A deacylase LpxR family protein n=1 Tax=Polaribacter sp. R77954 TaxID=3093870 RepID=UPI0037C97A66